jgi:hypothetical protein
MKHKSIKKSNNQITKYTAFIPKTLRATKNVGKFTIKKINLFLRRTTNTVKRTTKMLNRGTAKSIRSLTKKHSRR